MTAENETWQRFCRRWIALCGWIALLLGLPPLGHALPARPTSSSPASQDAVTTPSWPGVVVPPVARRVASDNSSDATLLKEAERLYLEGRNLARQNKYREALAKFLASYRIVPSGTTQHHQRIRSTLLFFIGRCYHLLKQFKRAGLYYRRFVKQAPANKFRTLSRQWLKELWPRLKATLVVQGTEGVQCAVKEPRGEKTISLPKTLEVEGGEVELRCTAEGFQPRRWKLSVPAQSRKVVEVTLKPVPRRTPPSPPRTTRDLRWIAVVVGGAGLATVGVGGAFGGLAMASRSAGEEATQKAVSSGDASFTRQALAADQDAQQRATTANVLYGVGGGVAILGVILYFVLTPKALPAVSAQMATRAVGCMACRKHLYETRSPLSSSEFSLVVSP